MSCAVKKSTQMLVGPAEPTPAGTLAVSVLDRWHPAVRFLRVEVVLVYEGPGPSEPAKVVREALSKTLVHYYPVAGRIVDNSPTTGHTEISCTGEGVSFVEASADCSLEDVGYLDGWPLAIPQEHLFPSPPRTYDDQTPLWIQVTQFQCGGFALGVRFNHLIFDGVGIGQFMKAVSEAAEGHSQPTVKPVWLREKLPAPPRLPMPPPPIGEAYDFETLVIDISSHCINTLKMDYLVRTGEKCTTFEILTAKVWQSRVRAIGFEPHRMLTCCYPVDIRKFQEVLPSEGGYYGNCVYTGLIQASAGKIMSASLVDIIGLVRNSKDGIRARFLKWLQGDVEEEPYQLTLGYEPMIIADWRMLGLSEVVLGSKEPLHVFPTVRRSDFVATSVLLRSPKSKQGVRLLLHCVSMDHFRSFCDEMKAISSSGICFKSEV